MLTNNCAKSVQTGHNQREKKYCLVRCKARQLNDGGAVIHYCIDANELLEYLEDTIILNQVHVKL